VKELELMKLLQGASYGSSALLFLAIAAYLLVRTFTRADAKNRMLFAEISANMAKQYAESQTKQANEFASIQLEQYKRFTDHLNESKQREVIIANEQVQLLRTMQHEMVNKTRVLIDLHESMKMQVSTLIELRSIIERNHAETLLMISKKS
jgi:hypothetical protein